jgi:hypothetical protein
MRERGAVMSEEAPSLRDCEKIGRPEHLYLKMFEERVG